MENLPSFLSLGKALLMLFVGEEEDAAGFSQNRALLREMKTVVELGRSSMGQYLASWVHLCVHLSTLTPPSMPSRLHSSSAPSVTSNPNDLSD